MKDADLKKMDRADLEDEVMLLRAQVKVLQNELAVERAKSVVPGPVWPREMADPPGWD